MKVIIMIIALGNSWLKSLYLIRHGLVKYFPQKNFSFTYGIRQVATLLGWLLKILTSRFYKALVEFSILCPWIDILDPWFRSLWEDYGWRRNYNSGLWCKLFSPIWSLTKVPLCSKSCVLLLIKRVWLFLTHFEEKATDSWINSFLYFIKKSNWKKKSNWFITNITTPLPSSLTKS